MPWLEVSMLLKLDKLHISSKLLMLHIMTTPRSVTGDNTWNWCPSFWGLRVWSGKGSGICISLHPLKCNPGFRPLQLHKMGCHIPCRHEDTSADCPWGPAGIWAWWICHKGDNQHLQSNSMGHVSKSGKVVCWNYKDSLHSRLVVTHLQWARQAVRRDQRDV